VGPPHDGFNPVNLIGNLFNSSNSQQEKGPDGKPIVWNMFRSFFIAVHGMVGFDFKPSQLFGIDSFMQATLSDFDFNLREFRVYKGQEDADHEEFAEEEKYNKYFDLIKSQVQGSPITNFI
jgi:hypothetical protein